MSERDGPDGEPEELMGHIDPPEGGWPRGSDMDRL